MKTNIKDVIQKNGLKICPVCGGTGANPKNNAIYCYECGGLKVVNHFKVCLEVDIPYTNETDRGDNEYMIRDEISTIYNNLGVL